MSLAVFNGEMLLLGHFLTIVVVYLALRLAWRLAKSLAWPECLERLWRGLLSLLCVLSFCVLCLCVCVCICILCGYIALPFRSAVEGVEKTLREKTIRGAGLLWQASWIYMVSCMGALIFSIGCLVGGRLRRLAAWIRRSFTSSSTGGPRQADKGGAPSNINALTTAALSCALQALVNGKNESGLAEVINVNVERVTGGLQKEMVQMHQDIRKLQETVLLLSSKVQEVYEIREKSTTAGYRQEDSSKAEVLVHTSEISEEGSIDIVDKVALIQIEEASSEDTDGTWIRVERKARKAPRKIEAAATYNKDFPDALVKGLRT